MRPRHLTLCGFIVVALPWIASASFGSARQSQVTFRTPSGNVNCVVNATGGIASVQCWVLSARCYNRNIGQTVAYAWALPPYRGSVPRRFCPGDFVPATSVLRYGNLLRRGNVTCQSMRRGLRCDRRAHGFLLSRERQKTW
jgi:hypothetical protein